MGKTNLAVSLTFGGWLRLCVSALSLMGVGFAALSTPAFANAIMEERKLPMRFTWHHRNELDPMARSLCAAPCTGWVSAIGVVTSDTEDAFDQFATGRDLTGATVVLDSSGGSVLDAIDLGRRWRTLGIRTAVGQTFDVTTPSGERSGILADAYCESMCAFLLLAGTQRIVPHGAHVRVHQIWLGDRVDDAKAASYSAQDLMIVQRDVGRLTRFTFEMGGTGELLDIALSVPPWQPLRELSTEELGRTNVVNADLPTLVAADTPATKTVRSADLTKLYRDRVPSTETDVPDITATIGPRRTADALLPTGGQSREQEGK